MINDTVTFKKGLYKLNKEPNFNFQLNRVIMWNDGDLEDVKKIADKIRDSASWKEQLIGIGDQAQKEGRIKEAIAYYRMSEFFMYDGDSDKLKYYKKATEMFYSYYSEYFQDGTVMKYEVPYEDVKIPVLYAKAAGDKKDTIIFHGGNDSYFEEFFFPMLYMAQNGFDVYLFEGPGQGGVMRVQGKHFTHQWEKPVKALLDYLKLKEVTIIGASLGGMLAPRAAAYEKRIKRVIAWSIFPNFLDVALGMMPKGTRKLVKLAIKFHAKGIMNFIYSHKLKKDEMLNWGTKHGMYAYDAETPYDYLSKLNEFQILNVGHLIDQDMFILGSDKDHFIDYHLYKEEIDSLTNVHSLTFRLFTEKEEASGHCNAGNTKLVLDTMMNWIEMIKI